MILGIDTSTKACSVALYDASRTVDSRLIDGQQYSHAENLHGMIHDLLVSNDCPTTSLEAILVSIGPGSYTGLRIGVSAAKGLAYALSIPIMTVPTLRVLCEQSDVADSGAEFLCPMIDARRNEVYSAMYGREGREIREIEALILDDHPFNDYLEKGTVAFFGDGAAKFRDQLDHRNALFLEGVIPDMARLGRLAVKYFDEKRFENVAYFEPFYLKDFIAGKPKNKVF